MAKVSAAARAHKEVLKHVKAISGLHEKLTNTPPGHKKHDDLLRKLNATHAALGESIDELLDANADLAAESK